MSAIEIKGGSSLTAKGRVRNKARWRTAVQTLGGQIEAWRPQGFEVSRSPYGEDASVDVLELGEGGQKIVLEPAPWAQNEIPAQVDLWSSIGTRVRFVGPAEDASWRVISTDLVNMHVPWTREGIERLCNDLLYR